MGEETLRVTPVYVIPILASLLVSVSCALTVVWAKVDLTTITKFPKAGVESVFMAMIFVLISGLGATMIYLLLKHGVHSFLRIFIGVVFSILTFLLVMFYSELVFAILRLEGSSPAAMVLASLGTMVVVLEVFLRKGMFYEVIVLILGGAVGTILGASIPLLSAILILLLLAVYDVVAVFRGPVGKIAQKGLEHLPGISFSFRNVYIGLGDLTFYSMLVSRMFLSFGWLSYIASACGVLLGSYLSFKMVEKKGMFPGLPFSVLFGLTANLIVFVTI